MEYRELEEFPAAVAGVAAVDGDPELLLPLRNDKNPPDEASDAGGAAGAGAA